MTKRNSIRDGSSPRGGVPSFLGTPTNRAPSKRELRLIRRCRLKGEPAPLEGQLVTANEEESKMSDSLVHSAYTDKSPPSSQAIQQDLHHSVESGSDPLQQSPPSGVDLNAEQLLQHNSRKTNVSDFKREKKPPLCLPPSSNSAAWKEIDDELSVALPMVFTADRISSSDPSKLAIDFDNWLYSFFSERNGAKPHGNAEPSKKNSGSRPKRQNAVLSAIRKEKNDCKKARKALIKAGLKGSPEELAVSKRWFWLIRQHNRLRLAFSTHQSGTAASKAQNAFRKDPNKFASDLFKGLKKNGTPEFGAKEAQDYFSETYKDTNRDHNYVPLEGFNRPPQPKFLFSTRCPSMKELQKCVRRKRNKATPGFNGISYVPYKKCPAILRMVSKIVRRIWKSGVVPDDWALAFIVLLSKSDDLTTVSEFRPIAITSTIGKIFFSVVSERLQVYMLKNKFISQRLQKGFLAGMPGCLEHAFSLTEALKNANQHQRQIVVTWIDLANAYGSVRHNLIQFALHWYHVPISIRSLILDYYDKLMAKVMTKDWETGFFLFDIGLFQGCVLSTILFDCVFQLLLDFLKPLESSLGYHLKGIDLCTFLKAYADDLALITRSPQTNQKACDLTIKFLKWTVTMRAKPKKCVSVGFRQFDPRPKTRRLVFEAYNQTKYSAFDPKIIIDDQAVKFIVDLTKDDEFCRRHFKFLGMWIHVNLSEEEVMKKVFASLKDDIELIDKSKVDGLMKLWLYQFYVLSHLAWPFLVQNFPASFAESLQSSISAKLKKWAGIYRSADVGLLFRAREQFGLGLTSISMHFERMQIIKCSLLNDSPDEDVQALFRARESREKSFSSRKPSTKLFRQVDTEVNLNLKFPSQSGKQGLGFGNFNNNPSTSEKRKMRVATAFRFHREKLNCHSHSLARQSVWTSWVDHTMPFDLSWKNLIYGPGPFLIKFVLNSIINCVRTPNLMKLWGYKTSDCCPLCRASPCTLHHILVNCSWALRQSRYNWRHDSILANIELSVRNWIESVNDDKRPLLPIPSINQSFVLAGLLPKIPKGLRSRCDILSGAKDWILRVDYEKKKVSFPPEILSTAQRPDMVIYSKSLKKVILIELTCPAEEGITAANLRKKGRYASLVSQISSRTSWTPSLYAIEVGARGFVAHSTYRFLRDIGLPSRDCISLKKTLSRVSAKCSYEIYLHHQNQWWDPRDLLIHNEEDCSETIADDLNPGPRANVSRRDV